MSPRLRIPVRVLWTLVLALAVLGAGASAAFGQAAMPNPREVSGVPLPVGDVPVGTVIVRVIRGTFANNLSGVEVEFTIDGKTRRVKTDGSGRAEVSGLAAGARVKATTTVQGERLDSQEFAIERSGIRIVLAAADPETAKREEEDRRLAASTAVRGAVVFGPETRIVAEMSDDRLNVFYAIQILNTARTSVDPGGPVIIDLPREARGASVLQGSSPQAKAIGPRVTVTGPFAPGTTRVDVGYELPFSGATARLEQRMPAPLQQVLVLVPAAGTLDFTSAQAPQKQRVSSDGVPVIVGVGPGLATGQTLAIDLTGLPHHVHWPRYTALGLASALMALGIWAAVFTAPRRRAA